MSGLAEIGTPAEVCQPSFKLISKIKTQTLLSENTASTFPHNADHPIGLYRSVF